MCRRIAVILKSNLPRLALPVLLLFSMSSAATDGEKKQIFLINGYVNPPFIIGGEEYEKAIQELQQKYPDLANNVDIRVYDYQGLSAANNGSIFKDIRENPNSEKYLIAYSAGVVVAKQLVESGVPFKFVETLDGHYPPLGGGGVSINFQGKPVGFVTNIVTNDLLIHGTQHNYGNEGQQVPHNEPEPVSIAHKDLLHILMSSDHLEDIVLTIAGSDNPDSSQGGGGGGGPGTGWGGGSVGGNGGGGGGGESHPLWLRQSRPKDFKRTPGSGSKRAFSDNLLYQFVPPNGPSGEPGKHTVPKEIQGSNAVEVASMDYTGGTGNRTIATVFAARTINSVYEHDYAVCSRVHNYKLNSAKRFEYSGHWWWLLHAEKRNAGYQEFVVPITITINGSRAVVDSRYLADHYPSSISGIVLNYQICVADVLNLPYFLNGVLAALSQKYSVSFANSTEPVYPAVYASLASYRNPNAKLLMLNNGESRTVRFFGPTWSRPDRASEKFFDISLTLTKGISEVDLPLGAIQDAVIYIKAGDFLDKVYISNGYWYAFGDSSNGGTSQVVLRLDEIQHSNAPNDSDWFVSPPMAEMTGVVTNSIASAYIGISYVFQQWREPVNLVVNGSVKIAFWAKGDGKRYRVKLETTSVRDYDYHSVIITVPLEWTRFEIPFSSFKQEGWGKPVPWTGRDVEAVTFLSLGQPHLSAHLIVDHLSFIESNPVTNVTAANYKGGEIAGESMAAAFGTNLADETLAVASLPLPQNLNGNTVKVQDSLGVERLAPLFFISPTQVNYQIPKGTALGETTITLTANDGSLAAEMIRTVSVAPGLFTADSSGRGLAAALVFRHKADGRESYEPVVRLDQINSRYLAEPIDLGPDLGAGSDQVFLVLNGTGFRNRSSLNAVSVVVGGSQMQVVYAGEQKEFVGLDQINVLLQRNLAGRGEVDVVLTVDGKVSNTARIAIK